MLGGTRHLASGAAHLSHPAVVLIVVIVVDNRPLRPVSWTTCEWTYDHSQVKILGGVSENQN